MALNNKTNLGWHYYRNYFLNNNGSLLDMTKSNLGTENTEKLFKIKNRVITETSFDISYFSEITSLFQLKTTYPGLLLGSGYGHEISAKGEFKLGFFFDFTTGLPIIPGSSIKGTLRSVFPDIAEDKERNFPYKPKGSVDLVRIAWLKAQMDQIDNPNFLKDFYNPVEVSTLDKDTIKQYILLTLEIFEGLRDFTKKKNEERYFSIYKRDIFHDATISMSGANSKIIGSDSITPHIKEGMPYNQSMLKNPVPIPFLKVLPNVVFSFRFDLNNSFVLPEFNISNKIKLFQKILLTLGIGAKTNVGYGQFSEIDENKNRTGLNGDKGSGDKKPNPANVKTILDEVTKATDPVAKLIEKGSEWDGEIVSAKRDNFLIVFMIGEEEVTIKKKSDKFKNGVPEIGKKVKIKFNDFFKSDPPNCIASIL
jgi:CRISPR-associated protein Cmr6